MGSDRVWTPESAQAWRDARDEKRKSTALKPYTRLTPSEKDNALRTERESVIESELSVLTTQAWDFGKCPIVTYPAPISVVLLLPKNHHATGGMERLKVHKGDDLNWIVYKYYDKKVDAKTYPGENYISKDGFIPKRFSGNIIEIEWWESYIKDRWIGTKNWKVGDEFDEVVEGWFLIDRNEF